MGENPDAQDDQAEEEEEENEEEDDGGGEDAADANNGAQGNGCCLFSPFPHDLESMPSLPWGEGLEFSKFNGFDVLFLFLLYFGKLAFISMWMHKYIFCLWNGALCVLKSYFT